MPRRYEYGSSAYRLTCLTPGCGQQVLTTGGPDSASRDDIDQLTGRRVADIFRFQGDGRGNAARCRECEAARRGQRSPAARRSGRVPATRVGAMDRPFGVEIEFNISDGPYRYDYRGVRAALEAEGLHGWKVTGDGSLGTYGMECVSPVLRGDDGHEQVRTACRVLRACGATVDRSTGMHVHHDARDLTVENIKQVFRTWAANWQLIDGLVAPSRRGDRHNHYCRPLGSSDLARIEACTTLSRMRTVCGTDHYDDRRYRTLNIASYGRYGTIEDRQHQGTLDAEKISSRVRFTQGLIEAACRETAPRIDAQPRLRDLLDRMGESLHETARTFLLGRAVEFGHCQV